MRKLCLLVIGPIAVLIVLAWLFSFPASALAAGLVRPLPGSPILEFNSAYRAADGQTRYHTGIDISGETGARVGSAGKGQVTFCGRVPAPAASSERVLAVTVRLSDGRLATYLPLAQTSVSKGDSVAEGDSIGTLAGTGDASSDAPHLHLGVRENGTYVDPSPLPIAVPPGQTTRPSPQPQGSPTPHGSPLPVPKPHPPAKSALPAPSSAQAAGQGSLSAREGAAKPGTSALVGSQSEAGARPQRPLGNGDSKSVYRARLLPAHQSSRRYRPIPAEPGAAHTADRDAGGTHLALPSVGLHPGWLMAVSGAMFAAASTLGAWKKRRSGLDGQRVRIAPAMGVRPAVAHQSPVGTARCD